MKDSKIILLLTHFSDPSFFCLSFVHFLHFFHLSTINKLLLNYLTYFDFIVLSYTYKNITFHSNSKVFFNCSVIKKIHKMEEENNISLKVYELPSCSICLAYLNENIVGLKCGHVYHQDCLK